MSAFSKSSVFTRPHDNMKTAFSKRSTLESVFEKVRFGDRKHRLRVNANPKRIKKEAFSKISGYVWTGPKAPFTRERNRSVPSSFQFLERKNRPFTRERNDCVSVFASVHTGTQSFRF